MIEVRSLVLIVRDIFITNICGCDLRILNIGCTLIDIGDKVVVKLAIILTL